MIGYAFIGDISDELSSDDNDGITPTKKQKIVISSDEESENGTG